MMQEALLSSRQHEVMLGAYTDMFSKQQKGKL